ncbi:putative DNA-binding pseudobarrel domain superfamily [Helianthus anomalus]
MCSRISTLSVVFDASGKKWVVRLKRVNSMPVTDGWQIVASDLNLQKDCLLTFLPLSQFGLNFSCYVNDVCDESYYTINRYLKLGVTIIEDAFVQECFGDNPPTGVFELSYKGSLWTVSISKLHSSYVFSQGWPEVCNDLGIQEDDLLMEIRLSKKVESDEDGVFQISKADNYETLLKDIEEDYNICITDENPSFSKVLN